MKGVIFTFLITILLPLACSDKHNDFREEIKDNTLFQFDKSNIMRLKAPLVNGMKNGEVYTFDEKGRLHAISTYVNDTKQGIQSEYYPSRIKKSEAYYLKGKKFAEYIAFYDGFQDSTALLRDGKWWITAYPTKIKVFKFYDLREKVMYFREYDINGNLLQQKGRLFQATFKKTIIAKQNKAFSQVWIIPDASHLKQLKIKQYCVVTNLSDNSRPRDTVYSNPDSTMTMWSSKIAKTGEYRLQAVVYLLENGTMETDTSNFTVKVE
ncbi:toxin-antitoxin system YwqK family antitoxin [Adhaeribacter pallidiroseus]|uniref:Uncharacterized protein n=1 Tax=Adhaeribacter pallidiroseus TaxID=2072847 RepID=A0A369QIR4_9BACT|nr:hypothetical protein [Adhaeribacter pallidiroseus]RDC62769.1 hypothetical protein AHMF7616_01363 [Adhaeribacter pallidiroseus]